MRPARRCLNFIVSNDNHRALLRPARRSSPHGHADLHPGGQRQRHGDRHRAVCRTTAARPTAASTPAPPQTFTITVTAVNDAPSFTKGADQTVARGRGRRRRVTGWATAISCRAGERSRPDAHLHRHRRQQLGPVRGQPADRRRRHADLHAGAANANGVGDRHACSCTDDGGTANGGVDTSAAADLHHHRHAGQRRAELHQGRGPDACSKMPAPQTRRPAGPRHLAPGPPMRPARR